MDLGLLEQLSVATSIMKRLPWTKKRPSQLLLVEICKIFHNENKYVKCNEFSLLSLKTIRFAWNSSMEPQDGCPYRTKLYGTSRSMAVCKQVHALIITMEK